METSRNVVESAYLIIMQQTLHIPHRIIYGLTVQVISLSTVSPSQTHRLFRQKQVYSNLHAYPVDKLSNIDESILLLSSFRVFMYIPHTITKARNVTAKRTASAVTPSVDRDDVDVGVDSNDILKE